MSGPLRSWGTLVCFLLLFGALAAFGSRALDAWILALVWGTFLIGSVILIIKSARQTSKPRQFYFGQTAWLPRSWRRWILDENTPPQPDSHRSAGNPNREGR